MVISCPSDSDRMPHLFTVERSSDRNPMRDVIDTSCHVMPRGNTHRNLSLPVVTRWEDAACRHHGSTPSETRWKLGKLTKSFLIKGWNTPSHDDLGW